MKHGDMKDEMLTAIALRYPFALKEVYDAYQMLESYDLTIKACEFARGHFIALPTAMVEVARKSVEPKACCDAMEEARSMLILHRSKAYLGSLWIANRNDTATMMISFCPFCGRDFQRENHERLW